jgi:DNA-binding transcriptional LysR family regulator
MDRLTSMNAFAHVVDAGSFTGAAERLGVTKAAISKSVKQLEKDNPTGQSDRGWACLS